MTLTVHSPRPPTQSVSKKTAGRPSPLLAVFLVSLALPLFIHVGPLRLSPYRLLLLLAVLPLFFGWLGDNTMKKRLCDWLIVFYVAWAGLAMVIVMGPSEAIQPTGMLMIETFGAFFLARQLVRDADSYEFVVRWMFRIIVVLLPFAIAETLTGQNVALRIIGMFGPVDDDAQMEPRWGFDRVQGPFSHPILYGVFCGSAIGMVAFLNAEIRSRLWRMWLVFFTGIWCLSSGPLTGFVAQMATIIYERATRGIARRWNMIGLVIASGFLTVNMLSNRTPFEVFISYFAFNAHTAYNRIRIWQYGSASVVKHPLFGLGEDPDWERPEWMSSSADMFWLVPSMKYGLPGGLALIGAFLYIAVRICREPISDPRVNACRTGLLISLVGLFLAGWTVHYWNATYVLICFLFGAGCWMFEADRPRGSPDPVPSEEDAPTSEAPPRKRTIL